MGDLSSEPRSKRKIVIDTKSHSKAGNSQIHSNKRRSSTRILQLDQPVLKDQEEYND